MQIALLTVGDELLSGDTANSNATWLARELTDRGASVARILTLPDDAALIARWTGRWSDRFDAVIVTGGIGGTPDDVTIDGVAAGLDRDLEFHEGAYDRRARRGRITVRRLDR